MRKTPMKANKFSVVAVVGLSASQSDLTRKSSQVTLTTRLQSKVWLEWKSNIPSGDINQVLLVKDPHEKKSVKWEKSRARKCPNCVSLVTWLKRNHHWPVLLAQAEWWLEIWLESVRTRVQPTLIDAAHMLPSAEIVQEDNCKNMSKRHLRAQLVGTKMGSSMTQSICAGVTCGSFLWTTYGASYGEEICLRRCLRNVLFSTRSEYLMVRMTLSM